MGGGEGVAVGIGGRPAALLDAVEGLVAPVAGQPPALGVLDQGEVGADGVEVGLGDEQVGPPLAGLPELAVVGPVEQQLTGEERDHAVACRVAGVHSLGQPSAGPGHRAGRHRRRTGPGELVGHLEAAVGRAEHDRLRARRPLEQVDQGIDRRRGPGGDQHRLAAGHGVEGDRDDGVGLARPRCALHHRDGRAPRRQHRGPLGRRERERRHGRHAHGQAVGLDGDADVAPVEAGREVVGRQRVEEALVEVAGQVGRVEGRPRRGGGRPLPQRAGQRGAGRPVDGQVHGQPGDQHGRLAVHQVEGGRPRRDQPTGGDARQAGTVARPRGEAGQPAEQLLGRLDGRARGERHVVDAELVHELLALPRIGDQRGAEDVTVGDEPPRPTVLADDADRPGHQRSEDLLHRAVRSAVATGNEHPPHPQRAGQVPEEGRGTQAGRQLAIQPRRLLLRERHGGEHVLERRPRELEEEPEVAEREPVEPVQRDRAGRRLVSLLRRRHRGPRQQDLPRVVRPLAHPPPGHRRRRYRRLCRPRRHFRAGSSVGAVSDPSPRIRRVVVSGGSDGRVRVEDAAATAVVSLPAVPGTTLVDLWRSDEVPLDLGPTDDPTATPFALMPAGSLFRVIDLGPTGDAEPMWHRTDSVDCIYVASGCCSLLHRERRLDLGAGDTVVVRGIEHAWINEGDEVCRLVDVSIAATGGPAPTEEDR